MSSTFMKTAADLEHNKNKQTNKKIACVLHQPNLQTYQKVNMVLVEKTYFP